MQIVYSRCFIPCSCRRSNAVGIPRLGVGAQDSDARWRTQKYRKSAWSLHQR